MAVFNDFELTNAGINLLAEVSTGKALIFTKVQLGEGNFIGNVKFLTSLFSPFKDVTIDDVIIHEDNSVDIKSQFDNVGFLAPKEWKEIGIFAKAGDTGTEVLYSYSYSFLTVETIPAELTQPYRRDLSFRNYISDATNVTYNITIQKDKYDFDTDVAMQSATYLVDGDRVNVWKADSCQKRRVSTTDDNGILLNNGLYANLILDIQGKYDNSLVTISKYVVPAINEIKSNLDANTGGPTEGNIQDVGTKEAGKVYEDAATNKLFLCIQTTTSTVNSTTYFEDITNLGLNTKINNIESYSETIINSDNATVANGSNRDFTLSEAYTNFDAILFEFSKGGGESCDVAKTLASSTITRLSKIDIYQGGDGTSTVQRQIFLAHSDNTTFNIRTRDEQIVMHKIIGINY